MSSPKKPAWFITGTDTEVGKTFATCALILALRHHGIRAIGMKPIAAGTDENGRNDDVERLIAAGSLASFTEAVSRLRAR